MIGYALRRLLWSIPVLFIVSVLVFVALKATTDPAAVRGPGITSEDVQRFRADLGLDEPAHMQYLKWLGNFLRGDLGDSLLNNRPVWPDLWQAMKNTIQLALVAFLFYISSGIIVGTMAALKHNSLADHAATGASFIALSFPPFFFGLMLQIIVGIYLSNSLGEIFTITNGTRFDFWSLERLRALALPAATVCVQTIAVYSRYMRSSMLDVLNADYLRTARAKGVSERRVIVRHAMRNALIPLTTFTAIDLGGVIGGLIVTESVFEWHGMGWYFLRAFFEGDYTRVLPWTMIVVGSVVIFSLIADLLYGVLDPRIRNG